MLLAASIGPDSLKPPRAVPPRRGAGADPDELPGGDARLDWAAGEPHRPACQQVLDLLALNLAGSHTPADHRSEIQQRSDLHLKRGRLEYLQDVADRGGALRGEWRSTPRPTCPAE